MEERRDCSWKDLRENLELSYAIQERFKMERHPEASVDGDNPWDRDLFDEEDEA